MRAANTVTRLRIVKNHTTNVSSAEPSYALGASGDTAICIQYEGNTSTVSPASGLRGGQQIIVDTLTTRVSTSDLLKTGRAGAAPTTGTWTRGDILWADGFTLGLPKGWVCTLSGTDRKSTRLNSSH